ncbi:proton channel OtopLc-like [Agrilus planipennis]|uniref:Proton channel OtopLc-like n=1 Tax=Agrilus planipennis TaxID=224129 RepID=A0A1W4XC06_AGRPL|nr:proton channel OtopLc-like [Agrilus planipennis]
MPPGNKENEPNITENYHVNSINNDVDYDAGDDNGFDSPGVTLRRNFKFDTDLAGSNPNNETNKLYQRCKCATNSCPSTPSRPHSSMSMHNASAKKKVLPRNGNVLLQVVLPPGLHRSATNPENIFSHSATSNDTFMDQPDNFYRVQPSSAFERELSVISSQAKRLGSEHSTNYQTSSPKEKDQMFRGSLSLVLSCAYGLLIVVSSSIVYIHDVFQDVSPLYEILTFYLILVAAAYLVFLVIDIRIYLNQKNKYIDVLKKEEINEIQLQEYPEGALHFTVPLPENSMSTKPLPHNYCFVRGRHSELLYLKIGATAFCLGHLIHSVVILVYQFIYISDGGDDYFECGSVSTLIMDIIYPCYSLVLLFFIFKYANIIINRHTVLARFGLMHCIASSLSFWIWTIIKETANLLRAKQSYNDYNKNSMSDTEDRHFTFPKIAYSLDKSVDKQPMLSHAKCDSEVFNDIYTSVSPYLYPFSVEFSILAVGVLMMVYMNIAECKRYQDEENSQECHNYLEESEESNIVIHLDCHSSSKGLFFGIIAFIISANSVILFFVVMNNESLVYTTKQINTTTEGLIGLAMLIVSILAYEKIRKLDVNPHGLTPLDDILLFICLPAFFAYFLLSLYPMIYYGNILYSISLFIEITQVLIQTPLIVDGLRRCSNDRELRKTKPGRELMMFLIIANVAIWINETFTYKGDSDERYDYYGTTKWVIGGHIALPLKMFYRFHSSVCLVDIWKYAYEPSKGH